MQYDWLSQQQLGLVLVLLRKLGLSSVAVRVRLLYYILELG